MIHSTTKLIDLGTKLNNDPLIYYIEIPENGDYVFNFEQEKEKKFRYINKIMFEKLGEN